MSRLDDRKQRQAKGQFWTPDWIADALVAYALPNPQDTSILFDPAVGEGHLLRAAARRSGTVSLAGCEIDPAVLSVAKSSQPGLDQVELRDFFVMPISSRFSAIVANPPYLRHHSIPLGLKQTLAKRAEEITQRHIDGRAGLHVHFLIWCLSFLAPEGRLSFIVPADVCEGVFSQALWSWIASSFRVDGIITFKPGASPFPELDTNPVILNISNRQPTTETTWTYCSEPTSELATWVAAAMPVNSPPAGLTAIRRQVSELVVTGASRPPRSHINSAHLGDFIRVQRGVATGANQFFLFTKQRLLENDIPTQLTVRTVARTRDLPGDTLTELELVRLDRAGRPTYLLSLDDTPHADLPISVQNYLSQGETLHLPKRPFLAARSIWYKSETRNPAPPYLFSYLGRRNTRFIANLAGVTPLSSFLCVYPQPSQPYHQRQLQTLLNDPRLLAQLSQVGKSYGNGAIKVEPRALESLPVPNECLTDLSDELPTAA